MIKRAAFGVLVVMGFSVFFPAHAEKCKAPKSGPELSAEEIRYLYECLQPKLQQVYGQRDHEVGSAYSGWTAGSSRPAAPGVHSGQYLMTYVNDVGYEQYVQYKSDSSTMPVGTVIAKESFTIKDSGKIKYGPLLIMSKVGDSSAVTGGWEYSGVKPSGKVLKVDGPGFCHACHQAYPTQDFLGYPVPDARISTD